MAFSCFISTLPGANVCTRFPIDVPKKNYISFTPIKLLLCFLLSLLMFPPLSYGDGWESIFSNEKFPNARICGSHSIGPSGLPQVELFCVSENGTPLGYFRYCNDGPETMSHLFIRVEPGAQGYHIGSQLYREALNCFPGGDPKTICSAWDFDNLDSYRKAYCLSVPRGQVSTLEQRLCAGAETHSSKTLCGMGYELVEVNGSPSSKKCPHATYKLKDPPGLTTPVDPPTTTPPRPSVTGCTTPRLLGSSRITSTYSQWLNSSASQCSAGQGLRGAQRALNFVQMMNPYLAPCVDTFQNEVLTGIDELDPTESKFFSNSVCQITGGIGLGYGLGAAASTCAEFGGVTNTICLSVGATELGAPLAAVGGTAVCAGACVYVAGHGAVNCYNHSPSQGYAPEYGYSTGYFDNACDIYGDLLPEGPSWDDYGKSNFIEELLSYIPSSGPVRRPVCREKRDPITGRMGVDCRR